MTTPPAHTDPSGSVYVDPDFTDWPTCESPHPLPLDVVAVGWNFVSHEWVVETNPDVLETPSDRSGHLMEWRWIP